MIPNTKSSNLKNNIFLEKHNQLKNKMQLFIINSFFVFIKFYYKKNNINNFQKLNNNINSH